MDRASLQMVMSRLGEVFLQNCDYLVELDQKNGDGDLGISMKNGFRAMADFLDTTQEADLGRLFLCLAGEFNEAAPSSLGTIISLGLTGMAQSLKGKQRAGLEETAQALLEGIACIMHKAGSKPGEKTILDALCPAVDTLLKHCADVDPRTAWRAAAQAAREGSERTRYMMSKHGRAAYYGEKSIGVLDGGSAVGRLVFETICECCGR